MILEGKVAIVTGGGRGIGRGEARLLAAHGARVLVNDLGVEVDGRGGDPAAARAVVEEIEAIGGEAFASADDVSEPAGAQATVATALERWGRLDILVNNAGFDRASLVTDMPIEDWDAVVQVHLRHTFCMSKLACTYWRDAATPAGQGRVAGRLINTTSALGTLHATTSRAAYAACKAGIAAFTRVLALEMEPYGVTCNALAPGGRTRRSSRLQPHAQTVGEGAFDPGDPDLVAPGVVWLASDDAQWVTGQVIVCAGGALSVLRGWERGPSLTKPRAWTPDEIGKGMRRLFGTDVPDLVEELPHIGGESALGHPLGPSG